MANHIDLSTVLTILAKTGDEADTLDGTRYDDDGLNSSEKAIVGRRLNRLADDLALASALVRNEYWEGRR